MLICKTAAAIREFVRKSKVEGKIVGFVPTMGYLHQGHMSLVQRAQEECGTVVVSIFVNPLQFGPREDFADYPRDFTRDINILREYGVDALFHPETEEMYPGSYSTYLEVKGLSDCLCGQSRPGHFRGVATVVTKLFNIVQPDRAYFGQKDAQQVMVISRVVRDLHIPVQVVTVPTVREADGLAMSSRNVYLNIAQRKAAPVLYQSLQAAAEAVLKGERDVNKLETMVWDRISVISEAIIDYVEIRSLPDLRKQKKLTTYSLMALAVKLGKTRLIDNIILEVDPMLHP